MRVRRPLASLIAALAVAGLAPTQDAKPFLGTWSGLRPLQNGSAAPCTMTLAPAADGVIGVAGGVGFSAYLTGALADGKLPIRAETSDGQVLALELARTDEGLYVQLTEFGVGFVLERTGDADAAAIPRPFVVPADLERPTTVDRRDFDAELGKQIDALVAAELEKQSIVGLSLAIGHENRVRELRSYGWQDVAGKVPATAKTRYRWASISKPVTAVIALGLAAMGNLDLDADVRELVPEFPDKDVAITTRQLLCHQSGITHYANARRTIRDYDVPHPFADRILALDMFKESPLVFAPGSKFGYSTHAYSLLGAVAERAAKKPFDALVAERIAKPLGMSTLQPDYEWVEIPDRAEGYHRTPDGRVVQSLTEPVAWKVPGGGLISTVEDLARFGLGLCSDVLLDEEWRGRMFTAQETAAGEATRYGLGIGVGEDDGRHVVQHSGSQNKTATMLTVDVESGVVVALMSNSYRSRLGGLAARVRQLVVDHVDG